MLPYATIHEAERALGRDLNVAEALWFHYSATRSDFLLFMHNMVFFWVLYTVLPLPITIMQVIGDKTCDGFKIQPTVRTPFTEIAACYKKVLLSFIFVVCPGYSMLYPVVKIAGIRTSLPLPSVWEMLSQLLVYILAEDYANYWIHRLLHCEWGYQKIHRVHHEYEAPFGYAAPRAHWAEAVLLGLPTFLGPFLCPGHMITFWVWFVLRETVAIEAHAGYEFPWSPSKCVPFYAGAAHHDHHHFVGGKCRSNFASIFTYCDHIYGTNKPTLRKP